MIRVKGISKTVARKAGTVQATIKVVADTEADFNRLEEFVKLFNKLNQEQVTDILDGVKAKEVLAEVHRAPVHRLRPRAGTYKETYCEKNAANLPADRVTAIDDDDVTCAACLRAMMDR